MSKVKVSGRRGKVISRGKKPPKDGVTRPKAPGKTKLQKLLKY